MRQSQRIEGFTVAIERNAGTVRGDPGAFASQAETFLDGVYRVLFGHPLNLDESQRTVKGYSEDFWAHVRNGLQAAQKEPDGCVRERRRI